MRADLPDEIREAIECLEDAEKKVSRGIAIEEYLEALSEMNDCADDYPEYKTFINNINSAYMKRMIDILYNEKPEIDDKSWIALILTLFIKNKNITIDKIRENHLLKDYFVHLLGLWTDKTPPELSVILDQLLENK